MLTIVIIIAAITFIIAVTLGLVFGLRKSGKSCTVKVSVKNGKMSEYKDSCNSSFNLNNRTKPGELHCKLSEKDYLIMNNQIHKGGNVDLKFTGVCSKFPNNAPGAKPSPPPPSRPKSCIIDLSFNYPKRTPGPNPKIFLEEIRIQDSCSPSVKTAADYNNNNKTKFCYPKNNSELNDFINSFSNVKNVQYSTTFDGTCKPYNNVFSKNTVKSVCYTPEDATGPCPLLDQNEQYYFAKCCGTGTGCELAIKGGPRCGKNTCYVPWDKNFKNVECNKVDINCCDNPKAKKQNDIINDSCIRSNTPGYNKNGVFPMSTMKICCISKQGEEGKGCGDEETCDLDNCTWNCSPGIDNTTTKTFAFCDHK